MKKEYLALSLHPECICNIQEGRKTAEYRSWPTKIRGDVILCCTAFEKWKGFACLMVNIYDCVKEGDSYAFLFDNVRAVGAQPVRGQQRFFKLEIDPEIIDIKDTEAIGAAFDKAEHLILKKGGRP